jgi:hypothetical protein
MVQTFLCNFRIENKNYAGKKTSDENYQGNA